MLNINEGSVNKCLFGPKQLCIFYSIFIKNDANYCSLAWGDRANMTSQWATDPRNPECVQAILDKVSIGTDLSDFERTTVTNLIKDYPDIFALSLSEVFPVNFATHKLRFDPDTVLPKKVHQRPITEPQHKFFADIIDDMEKAGVI